MKRVLYIIYVAAIALAVMLFGGCEEQVFEYDFINNAGEEPTPTPTPGVSANKVIYYTSTDGKVITPNKDAFGVSIVSNTYTNGKGTITFSGTVTKIGEEAFYQKSELSSITIPSSVTSIGSSAFYDCSALASITIPNSVTSIGDLAFCGCTSITSVTIPNSVTSIGIASFSICASLKSIYGKFASEDNRCLIVNGELKSFAPAGLTTYSIPASVTSIGDYAFYYCSGLTSVTIPNSVTTIGKEAFYNCDSLTSVTIPNSVTSIGDWAFYYCTKLTSVTIPSRVTSIGTYAFGYCSGLTSVTIPNSVTSIGDHAFHYCSKLAEVYCKPTTPPTLVGSSVFDSNASGRKIYVPSASVDAYKAAKYWSEYADQIVAEGSSAPSIATNTIEYTSTDGNIVTPKSAADFGANIVSNVYENGKGVITFDGPVTKIGGKTNVVNDRAFYDCRKLLSITIPNSVTSIESCAFMYCTGLTSVMIGSGVTYIGGDAFYSCTSLTSITIPDSVTSIDSGVFSRCI